MPPHASVCAQPRLDATEAQHPSRVLIHAGKLVDGVSADVQTDVDLLIESDRVVAVGRSLQAKEPVRHVDLRAFTVLPGLIDVHTHLLHPGSDYVRGLVTKSLPA
ncbi:MAG TPA: hypothetical protein VI299_20220, partial [Polyangiales bacterium]